MSDERPAPRKEHPASLPLWLWASIFAGSIAVAFLVYSQVLPWFFLLVFLTLVLGAVGELIGELLGLSGLLYGRLLRKAFDASDDSRHGKAVRYAASTLVLGTFFSLFWLAVFMYYDVWRRSRDAAPSPRPRSHLFEPHNGRRGDGVLAPK